MSTLPHQITAIYRCGSMFRTEKSKEKLPFIYHGYISFIHYHPGQSQDNVAKYLCLNKSSAARHLAYLEENGYIERRKSETDKRETLVYPTEKLEEIAPEIAAISADWKNAITRDIDEKDYAVFLSVLEKIYDNAQELIYGGGDTE